MGSCPCPQSIGDNIRHANRPESLLILYNKLCKMQTILFLGYESAAKQCYEFLWDCCNRFRYRADPFGKWRRFRIYCS